MRQVIDKSLSHALVVLLAFALILPEIGQFSNTSKSVTENPYPPPTDVITMPDELDELTQTTMYLPLVINNFPPYPTTSWYVQTMNTEVLFD